MNSEQRREIESVNRSLLSLLSTIETRAEILRENDRYARAMKIGADLAIEIGGALNSTGILRKSRIETVHYYNRELDALCEAFEKEGEVEQTWVALGESDSGGEYHCRFCGANPGEECSDINTATSYASRIHTERTETDEC